MSEPTDEGIVSKEKSPFVKVPYLNSLLSKKHKVVLIACASVSTLKSAETSRFLGLGVVNGNRRCGIEVSKV